MFSGSYVALVTPFKNNCVDTEKLKELVEFHIKNGTSGIVPCGTTGESATLSHEEHEQVLDIVTKTVNKRVKVIAGTGSNCTEEAIMLTKYAEKIGCDGALVVSPYYNKPTQKGLYKHFKVIADSVKMPIMLYNIQSRTGVNIEPSTIMKLVSDCKNITAIKESSGSLDQVAQIKMFCPNVDLFSGDDALTIPVMSLGGVGVVSVVANIVPSDVSEMTKAFMERNFDKAKSIYYKLFPLVKAMFIETNPIPVKTAMSILGRCSADLRLPMCEMDKDNVVKLEKALKDYGLLK